MRNKISYSTILLRTLIFSLISGMFFTSCTAPKQYQKVYLNDAEMQLAPRKAEKFENNFQSYREGASGANGGKTGGGCGCN